MPRPQQKMLVSQEEWQASLDALCQNRGQHFNRLKFTPEQDDALRKMRKAGVPWREIGDWWFSTFGWGCPNTLRDRYKALEQ